MENNPKAGSPVGFNFLKTLADFLQNLKPPYTDLQKIAIKKIHVDSGGTVRDYEAVVQGTREGKLMPDSGTYQHSRECIWIEKP